MPGVRRWQDNLFWNEVDGTPPVCSSANCPASNLDFPLFQETEESEKAEAEAVKVAEMEQRIGAQEMDNLALQQNNARLASELETRGRAGRGRGCQAGEGAGGGEGTAGGAEGGARGDCGGQGREGGGAGEPAGGAGAVLRGE